METTLRKWFLVAAILLFVGLLVLAIELPGLPYLGSFGTA